MRLTDSVQILRDAGRPGGSPRAPGAGQGGLHPPQGGHHHRQDTRHHCGARAAAPGRGPQKQKSICVIQQLEYLY